MMRIFFREVVLLNEEQCDSAITNDKDKKLPFAVFIKPQKGKEENIEDYKELFTDIISERIKHIL